MTDYEEEQEMEIEALEAIFDEEFKPDSEQPEKKFSVVINDLEFLSKEIVLDFKYPETYPDVPAEFDIQPTLQLTNDQKERVREAMAAAAAEEAGNAMVFAMVTAAKDWLTENFDADNEVEEKEKVVAPELTQEERGTPVTKENFIEWHAAFLAQMKAQGKWTEAAKQEGLTGRQLFEGGALDAQLQAEMESAGTAVDAAADAAADAADAQAARVAAMENGAEPEPDVGVLDEDLFDDDDLSSDDSD